MAPKPPPCGIPTTAPKQRQTLQNDATTYFTQSSTSSSCTITQFSLQQPNRPQICVQTFPGRKCSELIKIQGPTPPPPAAKGTVDEKISTTTRVTTTPTTLPLQPPTSPRNPAQVGGGGTEKGNAGAGGGRGESDGGTATPEGIAQPQLSNGSSSSTKVPMGTILGAVAGVLVIFGLVGFLLLKSRRKKRTMRTAFLKSRGFEEGGGEEEETRAAAEAALVSTTRGLVKEDRGGGDPYQYRPARSVAGEDAYQNNHALPPLPIATAHHSRATAVVHPFPSRQSTLTPIPEASLCSRSSSSGSSFQVVSRSMPSANIQPSPTTTVPTFLSTTPTASQAHHSLPHVLPMTATVPSPLLSNVSHPGFADGQKPGVFMVPRSSFIPKSSFHNSLPSTPSAIATAAAPTFDTAVAPTFDATAAEMGVSRMSLEGEAFVELIPVVETPFMAPAALTRSISMGLESPLVEGEGTAGRGIGVMDQRMKGDKTEIIEDEEEEEKDVDEGEIVELKTQNEDGTWDD